MAKPPEAKPAEPPKPAEPAWVGVVLRRWGSGKYDAAEVRVANGRAEVRPLESGKSMPVASQAAKVRLMRLQTAVMDGKS